jgi:hypothetical protein
VHNATDLDSSNRNPHTDPGNLTTKNEKFAVKKERKNKSRHKKIQNFGSLL